MQIHDPAAATLPPELAAAVAALSPENRETWERFRRLPPLQQQAIIAKLHALRGMVSMTDEFIELTPENSMHLSAEQVATIEEKQRVYWNHAAAVARWSQNERRKQLQQAPRPCRPMRPTESWPQIVGHRPRERRAVSRVRARGPDDDPPPRRPSGTARGRR